MAKENRCLRCGAQMPADAPEGLCPKCLMKGVMSKEDADVTLESPRIEGPGTTIGRYKLLELIGEGGMGLVYLAEQQEPIRRRAALKIVKLGMDTKQVIARFEAEKQMLALLDHPNIARVYDAGTTQAGRPYFVMEYVKGQSITEYCDQHKTGIEDRLRLFRQVCEAVQYAHQKGIIHRDIKPSNILVSVEGDRAVPKIIDFGIAKAVTQQFTEGTLFTQQGQLLGTPEYMSPEQTDLATQDIDTRSDIYSLGVVLYQLLAGVLPFGRESFERGGFAEIQRVIQEVDPPNPSTALSRLGDEAKKIAERRKTQVVPLARRLHRELEWIPLKAMRKERVRRYRSASELADDIQNYLNGNPLIAGPETAMYRVRKFVRRHAGSVATVALTAAAIILGLVISTAMYLRSEKALKGEATARKQAEQAQDVAQEQRNLAETKAEDLRRAMYVNNIQLADSKYKEGNIRRVRELLVACPNDLRGWEWNRLNYIADQSTMTLRGHQDGVTSLALSPDGKRIISGSLDKTIKVWAVETGNELMTLQGHKEFVNSVAVSPDGRRIASGSADKTIRVWDIGTGTELMTIATGHEEEVSNVAFSPDGKLIVAGSSGGSIKVWDASNGTEIATLLGQEGSVCYVVFSPDGGQIASTYYLGKEVRIWDTNTGAPIMTLSGEGLMGAAFSPDGKRIHSGSMIWDRETGEQLINLRNTVNAFAFSPDGRFLVSGSDNILEIWDTTTGHVVKSFRGHSYPISSAVFTKDGQHVISGSDDDTVKVWDMTIDREITRLRGHRCAAYSMAFSPDGKRIISGGEDGIKVWDVASGAEVTTLRGNAGSIYSLAFSADSKRIISGSSDNTIKVWDAASRTELVTLRGHKKEVLGVAFSPDDKRIASGSYDNTIKVWDAATGAELMNLTGHIGWFSSIVFSPDGKRIISGSSDSDREIKVWEVSTGGTLMTLCGDTFRGVRGIAVSPDGERIAAAGENIRVLDLSTGKELMTLRGHQHIVDFVAFSPDGKRIVSSSRDGSAKVWDAITGSELITLPEATGSPIFSPDGKAIAARNGFGDITLLESAAPTIGYEPRKTGKAATKIVDELYEKDGFYFKVIDKLQADTTVDELVRKLALQIANARKWEDAEKLKEQIWEVVRLPNQETETYRLALENSEKANRLEPNNPNILNTLGVAQYRVGAYEDALKRLTNTDKIRTGTDKVSNPKNVAFIAMSLHQLGRGEEAKAALERLRNLLKDDQFAQDEQAKAFLDEAEKLIEGEK